jgi:hypothetical protein
MYVVSLLRAEYIATEIPIEQQIQKMVAKIN